MQYGNLRILDDFLTSEQAAGVFLRGLTGKAGQKFPLLIRFFPHPRQMYSELLYI
jgi:hypothetical protein